MIVIVPFNATVLTNTIKEAKKAGIKLLSYDRLILNADVDAYIATKQKPAGRRLRRAAGDAVVETRSGGPHMLVVPIQEVKNRVPLTIA